MTDPQQQFEQLIQHLSDISGHNFPINGNVCTLLNENDETAAVIELPEGSDLLIIHSLLSRLPSDPDIRHGRALQLLTLNGNPDRLRGTWFSIDDEGYGIHLMTSSPVGNLTTDIFENLLFNYIQLAESLKQELANEEQELASLSSTPISGVQA